MVQISAPPPINESANRFSFAQRSASINAAIDNVQPQNFFTDGILDSDSSISIFNNTSMLDDIHDVDTPLVLQSNGGGHQLTSQMGTVPNFGKVWYNPNSIANILSLAEVRKSSRVTMDSSSDVAFHIHLLDGSGYTRFKEHESGWKSPYESTTTNDNEQVIGYLYLQTVAENKKAFTKRQIEAADMARQLYQKLGRPGAARFMDIIRKNLIINCPITFDDVTRGTHLWKGRGFPQRENYR
jgi:hypothetical protein